MSKKQQLVRVLRNGTWQSMQVTVEQIRQRVCDAQNDKCSDVEDFVRDVRRLLADLECASEFYRKLTR